MAQLKEKRRHMKSIFTTSIWLSAWAIASIHIVVFSSACGQHGCWKSISWIMGTVLWPTLEDLSSSAVWHLSEHLTQISDISFKIRGGGAEKKLISDIWVTEASLCTLPYPVDNPQLPCRNFALTLPKIWMERQRQREGEAGSNTGWKIIFISDEKSCGNICTYQKLFVLLHRVMEWMRNTNF